MIGNSKRYQEAMRNMSHWKQKFYDIEEKYEKEKDEKIEALEDLKAINKRCVYAENKLFKQEKTISKLESEKKELSKVNLELMGLLKKVDPKWQIVGNRGLRYHPIREKSERYDIPKNFDDSDIEDFEISDDKTWIKFIYQENPKLSHKKKIRNANYSWARNWYKFG